MEKRKRMNDVKLLPSDVWVEILRRIPAADLVPLKAVCKTFHRLISSDLFARLHFEDFRKLPKGKRSANIILTYPMEIASHSNYYDPDKRTISVWQKEPRFGDLCSHVLSDIHHHRVIDSYHGLLLVQICDRLLLCNPITRSYKFLPSFSQLDFACWKIAYDDVSEQYKVFGLRTNANRVSLYVFDVHRDGELHPPREKVVKFGEPCHELLKESVLVDGSLCWLIITRWSYKSITWIVSANVTTEKLKTRSCSSTPLIGSRCGNFFVANGTFYHLGQQSYYTNCRNQLWVLKGVESENPNPSWKINHRITNQPLTSILRVEPSPIGAIRMFHDKLFITIMLSGEYQLYQYDLSSKEFEEVTLKGRVKIFGYFHIVEHTDSLISPETIKEEDVWV